MTPLLFALALAAQTAAPVPALRGIDTVPGAALAQTPSSTLLAVAADEEQPALLRARALRAVAVRVDVDAAAFTAVVARCERAAHAELRVQAVLAGADRAVDDVAFARLRLAHKDAAVRKGALLVLKRERSVAARALIVAHVDVDADNAAFVAAVARKAKR
jgi:hypothetical protein